MNGKKTFALYTAAFAVLFPILFTTSALADPLPPPWQHADIGNVGIPGDASVGVGNSVSVSGAGSDIWGTADSFHFAYQPMSDGYIFIGPPSQDGTNPFAKAGLMIRQSLDPGSPHVILDVRPDGSIEFMTRSTPGGETTFIAGGPPEGQLIRLQLIREHGAVTAVVCWQ